MYNVPLGGEEGHDFHQGEVKTGGSAGVLAGRATAGTGPRRSAGASTTPHLPGGWQELHHGGRTMCSFGIRSSSGLIIFSRLGGAGSASAFLFPIAGPKRGSSWNVVSPTQACRRHVIRPGTAATAQQLPGGHEGRSENELAGGETHVIAHLHLPSFRGKTTDPSRREP
jgi:hypothetical protein